MAKCSICGRNAFYIRLYSGENFCRKCYPKALEKRVQNTITSEKMLNPSDRIAVALSGGKDSVSLLHILSRLEKKYPKTVLFALTVDEGIAGYRDEALQIAQSTTSKLGIEHQTLSFKSLYGSTLDQLAHRAQELGQYSICTYCGILRRKALNTLAKDIEATKLVTAHNLDDEVQSLIMSLLRGSLNELRRQKSGRITLIPRIKPFRTTPEKEIALYAYLKRIRLQSTPCPYAETSLRNEVRYFLDGLEEKHPGMKFNVLRTFEKIQLPPNPQKQGECQCSSCGQPTSKDLCRACQILSNLNYQDNA